MAKILVTGAAGFIGSNMCDFLLDKGYEVIGVDNFDESYYDRATKESNIEDMSSNPGFTFYEADITRLRDMGKIFSESEPDKIIHLAARAGVRPSIERPRGHVRYNIEGTSILLELAARNNIKTFVFASSSSVYGNSKDIPFKETADISRPISQYAATKAAGETLCYTYHHLYDMDVSCLRFFTVYGPRGRPDMAIGKWTDKIYNGVPVELYGYGKMERDFTYIGDIVQGIYNAMEKAKGYNVYNLGNSETVNVRDLLGLIEKTSGKKAKVIEKEMQLGDVDITYADISKAREDIGYDPSTSIDEGIKKYIDWYKNIKNI